MWILRWILYLSLTFLSVILALATITHPKYNGKVKISSKYGKIDVYRDEHGIPHIFGANKEAAYYGIGYVQAQDRTWVMEKFRRFAKGSLSEYYGEETLPVDYFFRQLNLDHVAKESYKKLDPELKRDFSLVAEGINDYLKSNPCPIEYWILGVNCEPYTALDIMIVEKIIDFIVSYNHQMELSRDTVFKATNSSDIADKYMPYESKHFRDNDYPTINDDELKKIGLFEANGMKNRAKDFKPRHTKYPYKKEDIYEEIRDILGLVHFDGSNAWAVHGNHTESGKPILSMDPHLSTGMPTLWFFAELSYENITRSGVFSYGQPWITFGKTNDLAFGITAIHSDTIDLFEENVSEDGLTYEFDCKWLPIKQSFEVIKVRDPFRPSGYRNVELIINSTHHGILFNDPFNEIHKTLKRLPYQAFGERNLSLAWSGFQGISHYFSNNKCLNFAKDVHEGVECFRHLGSQNLNFFIVDNIGNIGLVPSVSYPIRKHPFAGAYIQDGSKSENDWQGFVPFDEIPKVINPDQGYIANSNNMISSQNVKYGIGSLMPSPPRVKRASQLIEAQIKSGKKFTAKDMFKFQLDSVDLNAKQILFYLFEIIDVHWNKITDEFPNQEFKVILRDFRKHLNGWDGDYTVNSTQASLFAIWEMEYHVNILADQIPSRTMRETMVNIPDSDLFLLDLLEHLIHDASYMNDYCQSKVTMWGKDYEIKENKCILSLAYNAVYAWKMLEKSVSKNPSEWRWGAIHKHYYEHVPFSQIPGLKQIFHREAEAAGSRRTLNFACYDYCLHNMEKHIEIRSLFASNFRASIDMATNDDPEKYPMYMTIDTGASGHVFSPHYFDMNEIHYSKNNKMFEIGIKNARKNAKYHLELIPEE
jgi:penicillin amidase